jgi:hypothetical protein
MASCTPYPCVSRPVRHDLPVGRKRCRDWSRPGEPGPESGRTLGPYAWRWPSWQHAPRDDHHLSGPGAGIVPLMFSGCGKRDCVAVPEDMHLVLQG